MGPRLLVGDSYRAIRRTPQAHLSPAEKGRLSEGHDDSLNVSDTDST